jgi:phosphoribosylformylglycinamidine synthase
MRIEVCFKNPAIDGRTNRVASSFSGSGFEGTEGAAVIDVYLTDAERLSSSAEGILAVFFDPVVQRVTVNDPALNSIEGPWDCAVEVTYKPGVTNPEAITARKAVENFTGRSLSRDTVVQTARQYVFRKKGISRETAKALSLKLHNPLIQHAEIILREDWEKGVRFPSLTPLQGGSDPPGRELDPQP